MGTTRELGTWCGGWDSYPRAAEGHRGRELVPSEAG